VNVRQRFAFWIGGLVVFLLLLYLLRSVLLPFVAGMAVAYFLDPVVDRVQGWGASRTVATGLITALFFSVVIVALLLLAPLIQLQITGFLAALPQAFDTVVTYLEPLRKLLETWLPEGATDRLQEAAGSYAGRAFDWLINILVGLVSSGAALMNLLSLLVVTPIVAFYLLHDWDLIVERLDHWLPRDHAETIRRLARDVDATLAGFARGQALVCLLLGLFYGIGLTIVGLQHGFVIGFLTGLISFVPFFGMLVGFVVGMAVAIAQFGTWLPVALVAGVFALGQFLEGNFVTPRLVGSRVGLHPVWMIFALLAGGALFGLTGVLLSVPAAAAVGVLCRFGVQQYLSSRVYLGNGATAAAADDDGDDDDDRADDAA
jgi:predicted PurR-regulated permease PerM